MQNKINKLMYAGMLGALVLGGGSTTAFADRQDGFGQNINNYYQQVQNYSPFNRVFGNDRGNNNNTNNNSNYNADAYIESADAQNSLEINNNGSVIVRGATVNSINQNTMQVTSPLGSANLTWTVRIDNGTKFEARNGQQISISQIAAGDRVTVKGIMQSGNTLSVRASLVRDTYRNSVPTQVNNDKQIFQGRLTVAPGQSMPTTISMQVGNTNYIVNLSGSTMLLNNSWNNTYLSNFRVGDTVRVFGYIPYGSNQITGLVLRNTNR